MPIIHVELLEGRTVDQKREFADMVTREGARILRCAPGDFNVVFVPVSRDDWATAGKLESDPK
ncbi:tautomerase family protein [Aestuariivirga sp.]|uniref:tautomerase family protein n=1 Tax=Aestuariivirga sp. TaxID=2650926 RepID=UPI0039E44778